MLIGLISDAHGNIYGLQKAVSLLEQHSIKRIYFLGDALNYFSKSKEVVDFLKFKRIVCMKGNHEIIMLNNKDMPLEKNEIYNIDFTRKTLEKNDYSYIDSWLDCLEISVDGLRMLMVHASPFNYFEEYIYPDNPLSNFAGLPFDVIFLGHTHMPFIKQVNGKVIVNIGSVGLPRDNGSYITCSLFDTDTKRARILTAPFPMNNLCELAPFHPQLLTILKRRKNM